jgi:hypothetical protein
MSDSCTCEALNPETLKCWPTVVPYFGFRQTTGSFILFGTCDHQNPIDLCSSQSCRNLEETYCYGNNPVNLMNGLVKERWGVFIPDRGTEVTDRFTSRLYCEQREIFLCRVLVIKTPKLFVLLRLW